MPRPSRTYRAPAVRPTTVPKAKPLPDFIHDDDLTTAPGDKRPPGASHWPDPQDPRQFPAQFTLHYTERFGWVVATLLIRKAGRRHTAGAADRTYAWSLSQSAPCRVGLGPHVLRTVQVHVKTTNVKRLQPLIDAHRTGLASAGDIRDRRSTGRMVRRSLFDF